VPVIARRRPPVVDLGQGERPLVLLVDALAQEVVEPAVVQLVRVLDHGKVRVVLRRVASVGVRGHISGIRRCRDRAESALKPAAAYVAHLAVPGSRQPAVILAIEGKPDEDADALRLPEKFQGNKRYAGRTSCGMKQITALQQMPL